MQLDTLLIVYPLHPPSLVENLRHVFKTVHFYPQLAGNDYSGRIVPPPPPEVLAAADVILCFNLPAVLTSFTQTPNLKLLQLVGAGALQVTNTDFFRSIPVDNGLILSNSTGIHVPAISEHVLMTVMALNHKLLTIHDINKNEKRWAHPAELGGSFIQEIRGQTFGILGYGHLGREIARLASAFGARIIACTREGAPKPIGGFILSGTGDREGTLPSAYFKTGDEASLHAFLGEADVVVNALPASAETRKFLGRREFEAMKGDAIVVNIGRGETMDQEALIEALQAEGERNGETGKLILRGAVLDVTDPEPLPPNHILFSMDNVILTPHVSWASKVNFFRAVELLKINKRRIEAGEGALNALRGEREKIH